MKHDCKRGWSGILGVLAALGLALVWTGQARAQITDPGQLEVQCSPAGTCTSGPVTFLYPNGVPTFQITSLTSSLSGTGTLTLVILTPTTATFTVSLNGGSPLSPSLHPGMYSSGPILTFLGVTPAAGSAISNEVFSFWQSASGQVIPPPSSFDVYTISLGSYTLGTTVGLSIASGKLPNGSVIYADWVNGTGQVTDVESTSTFTVVPEPATLSLVGIGLLMFGLALRRRMSPVSNT